MLYCTETAAAVHYRLFCCCSNCCQLLPVLLLQLPFVDNGDPDPELANDPLGLKQLGKAFGFFAKKKEEQAAPKEDGKKRRK
jgi:hypothetical protein